MPKKTLEITIQPTLYRYCGDGDGIPGLPHLVSKKEAAELGLLDTLELALRNGTYQPVFTETPERS
jgi:hypothetical protein